VAKAVLNVSEARRELPRLVRQVAAGGSAVRIGPRGQAAAVLVGSDEYAALTSQAAAPRKDRWAALRLEIVGSPEDLDAEMRRIRSEISDSIDRRAAQLGSPAKRRR
jgi:prevent-host-death family protein